MSLRGCLRCTKYFVFSVNFAIWIIGMFILGAGIFLRMDPFTNHMMTAAHTQNITLYHFVCYVLIGAGGVMTFIGFLGCCSAFQESHSMLGTFFALLLILFAAEVAAGVWSFMHQEKLKESVNETVSAYIQHSYGQDPFSSEPIDFLQRKLQCCGGKDAADWRLSSWHNSSKVHRSRLPASCCTHETNARFCGNTSDWIDGTHRAAWNVGCGSKIISKFNERLIFVGLVVVCLAAVQFLSIIFSIFLCCGLRRLSAGGYKS